VRPTTHHPPPGEPVEQDRPVGHEEDLDEVGTGARGHPFERLDKAMRPRYCGTTTSWPPARWADAMTSASSRESSFDSSRCRQPPIATRRESTSRSSASGWSST
jgi:hypothetical protein